MNPLAVAISNVNGTVPDAVLMGYQQEWVADQSQLKVEEKSRRTGLTWAEASDNVLIAASSAADGGMNVYYIAYNYDMTMEYIQACALWARVLNGFAAEIKEGIWGEGDDEKHIKTFTITFPSGYRITALSSRPANLRGRQGVVVIDEAAFHDKLDELLKAALALLIWGGKVRVISTHNGAQNPFNLLIIELRAGKRKGTVHRVTFREAVAQGLYRRVCLRKGEEWTQEKEDAWVADVYAFYGDGASEELDCIPAEGSGAWLNALLLEKRSKQGVPVLRFKAPAGFDLWTEDARVAEMQHWLDTVVKPVIDALPRDITTYHGEDFGRKADLSVNWFLMEAQGMKRVTAFVMELRSVPYNQQKQALFFCLDNVPRFRGSKMDGGGNGGYLAEQAVLKYGPMVEAVIFTEKWYRENTPAFKADLEDGTLDGIPADQDIVNDHRAFQLVRGVAKIPDVRTVGADGSKRHGDAGIAHLLAHAAARNSAGLIEFMGVGANEQPDDFFHPTDDDDLEEFQGDGCL